MLFSEPMVEHVIGDSISLCQFCSGHPVQVPPDHLRGLVRDGGGWSAVLCSVSCLFRPAVECGGGDAIPFGELSHRELAFDFV